ncbi:MAG: DmsE family decaheme c-type cytochrome [Proteobacteria bacterium]|nr:DmsE family decaheme c-type cytochrome [Desulfobulbaceae bacterium]MBU4153967.1 DmsE family decaheme c-type cytochrome [Pseudomonadota bacterium]
MHTLYYSLWRLRVVVAVFLGGAFLGGCVKSLKEAKPIIVNTAYDKQLLGNLAADYVGNDACMKRCHVHAKIKRDFDASTMGAQLKIASSGMMIVDCESCHGPGSETLATLDRERLTPKKPDDPINDETRAKIKQVMRKNFLHFDELPGPVRSQICLKCHTANADFNLHNWNASAHAINDVSCSDCHPIHSGPSLMQHPETINQTCMNCHKETAAEFNLPSHHQIRENAIYCTDCHEQHGSSNEKLLLGMTVKETCARCHTEKVGPFLWEHGDVNEDCMSCHMSHGSVNNNLLRVKEPFLCIQCHAYSHFAGIGNSLASVAGRIGNSTRCTDCHSQIHGTDTPSSSNNGRWMQ